MALGYSSRMEIFTTATHHLKRYFRSVVGVVILIIAFIAAIIIAHESNRTILLWATANELSSGAIIRSSDLVPIRALLPENADSYFSTDAPLVGSVVTHHMGAGELLATSSLLQPGSVTDSRYVPLEIAIHDLPQSITRGAIVDIYALAKNSSIATSTDNAQLIALATTVIDVDRKGDLSGSVGMVVNVRSTNVISLLSQISSHRILVVEHV